MQRSNRFVVVLWAFWSLRRVTSFCPLGHSDHRPVSRHPATALHYTSQPEDFVEDLEKAREAFERLVYGTKHIIRDGIIAQAQTERLFLTSTGRRFREVEMDLLRSLDHSDDALEELIHLWTTERDAQAGNELLDMQIKCSLGLEREETRLCQMIRTYPGWAEPYARLATLLYYKGPGHFHHADEVVRRALELKPFHFEAINLLVLIHTHLRDSDTVSHFKQRALPPLNPEDGNRDRIEWVNAALQQAANLWDAAEHTTTAIHKNQKPNFIMAEAWQ